jgi:uncharacterized protein (DUF1330 family)
MPAYVIVKITIHDPVKYEEYKLLTPATIAAYGGRFIVRGGEAEILEGNPSPGRIVVLEFPDTETAKRWWNSPEYTPAKELRQSIASTEMVLVEGFGG